VANKIDLVQLRSAKAEFGEYDRLGYKVLYTSATKGKGIRGLRKVLHKKLSVLAGPSGAGKSSLLNQLIQKDRAIVTDVPGTTRDVIEETLNLEGIPVVISDTAGVHHTDHPIRGLHRAARHQGRRQREEWRSCHCAVRLQTSHQSPAFSPVMAPTTQSDR